MDYSIVKRIDEEWERGIEKWGDVDRTPEILLNAAMEELGETAHAINHNEGVVRTQDEIVQVMGILCRLYEMVEEQAGNEK